MALKKIALYCMTLAHSFPITGAVSLVYNLRIAETTKRQISEDPFDVSTAIVTLFDQWRKRGQDKYEFLSGGMISYLALLEPFYVRIDVAAAYANEKTPIRFYSRSQTDDLLISGGYNYRLNKQAAFTFSALLGIPTHKDGILQGIEFGYGHVGIGAQIDGAFVFAHHDKNSIRTAVRCVKFLTRTIEQWKDEQWKHYSFSNGNLIDVFIAYNRKLANHRLECGYNPNFLCGGKVSHNPKPYFLNANNFIRNNFYGNYKYRFTTNGVSQAVQLSLSYGFDVRPKLYGRSHIISTWGSWIVNF